MIKSFKYLIIWWRANMRTDYNYWRVRYPDGRLTRLLCYSEAWNLREIFGGKLFIDYEANL